MEQGNKFYKARIHEKEISDYSDRIQKVIGVIFDSYQKQKQKKFLTDNLKTDEK